MAVIAHSYARFSTPQQATGDSLRRQQQQAQDLCKRRGWQLSKLTFQDLGRSAYKPGRQAALDAFLRAVDSGVVKSGEVLIVEAVDRLSRKGIRQTQTLVNRILDAGVSIAILSPVEKVYSPDSSNDIGSAIELAAFAYQANTYSENLSYRLREYGKRQRKRLAAGETVALSAKLPGWLCKVKGKVQVDEAHAKTVRHIFRRAAEGWGTTRICAELNERFKPWGSSPNWNKTAVLGLLRGRAVLGEVVSSVTGETFAGYYPAVIELKQWQRVQLKIAQRSKVRGRITHQINMLSGLMFHAGDGTGCRVFASCRIRKGKRQNHRRFISAANADKNRGAATTGAEISRVEDMVFSCLPEIKLRGGEVDNTVGLRQEKQSLLDDIGEIQKQITSRSKSAALLVPVLTSLQAQLEEVEGKLSNLSHSTAPTKAYREQLAAMRRGTSEERLLVAEGLRRLLSRIWFLPFKTGGAFNAPCGLIMEFIFHDGRRARAVEIERGSYLIDPSDRDLREQVASGWKPNVPLFLAAREEWDQGDESEAVVAFMDSFLDCF